MTPNDPSLQPIAARWAAPAELFVVRAKAILFAADGLPNKEIGERLDLPRQIISKWRKRFFKNRLDGLQDRPSRGIKNENLIENQSQIRSIGLPHRLESENQI
jgi:transposase